MSTYIQNFKKFRPLLTELIMRDIKTKYRKSILGVFWTILIRSIEEDWEIRHMTIV